MTDSMPCKLLLLSFFLVRFSNEWILEENSQRKLSDSLWPEVSKWNIRSKMRFSLCSYMFRPQKQRYFVVLQSIQFQLLIFVYFIQLNFGNSRFGWKWISTIFFCRLFASFDKLKFTSTKQFRKSQNHRKRHKESRNETENYWKILWISLERINFTRRFRTVTFTAMCVIQRWQRAWDGASEKQRKHSILLYRCRWWCRCSHAIQYEMMFPM